METLLPAIERGFVLFSTVAVFVILLANCFFFIRKRFPIQVNCWFCNTNTRVAYELANCFTCPMCQQYNGFNQDGSYNKDIPEQYICKRNNKSSALKQSPKGTSNGFCHLCNINQDLKVKQLAAFVPINENNFEHEVEEYEKKLEEAYKLCRKCRIVLKMTLSVQNSWLFGKSMSYFSKAQRSGSSLLNLNLSSHGITKHHKRSIVVRLAQFIQILLALFILRNNVFVKTILKNVSFSFNASQNMPEKVVKHFGEIGTFMANILNVTEAYMQDHTHEYFSDAFHSVEYHHSANLATIGLFAQIVLLIWQDVHSSKKRNTIAWIGLTMLSLLPENNVFHPYMQVVQTQLAGFIISAIAFEKFLVPKPKVKMIKKKIKSTSFNSLAEHSDEELLTENISNFSKNSSNSSSTARKTYLSRVERTNLMSSVLRKLNGSDDTDNSFETQVPHSSLNQSLNNLHLGSGNMNIKQFTKPVVSPAKFTATANLATTNPALSNLTDSRPSSSGYGSHVTENMKHNSLGNSRKNSLSDESDKSSSSELRNLFSTNAEPEKLNYSPENIFKLKSPSPILIQQNGSARPQCFSRSHNMVNNFSVSAFDMNTLNSPYHYKPQFGSHAAYTSPSTYLDREQHRTEDHIVYQNQNTLNPNLNQNSMLYIQVNKNQDFRPFDSSANKLYGTKLFNMEAVNRLSKLSLQKNANLSKM